MAIKNKNKIHHKASKRNANKETNVQTHLEDPKRTLKKKHNHKHFQAVSLFLFKAELCLYQYDCTAEAKELVVGRTLK